MYTVYELYSLGDITQALTYFMANMGLVQDGFTHCASGYNELMEGIVDLEALQSIGHATNAFSSAFKHHPIAMPLDVKKANDAWAAGDYTHLGDFTGDITKFVLDEC